MIKSVAIGVASGGSESDFIYLFLIIVIVIGVTLLDILGKVKKESDEIIEKRDNKAYPSIQIKNDDTNIKDEKTSTDIWIKNNDTYINKEEASLATIKEPKVTQAEKKVKRAEEYRSSNEFLQSFEWRRKRFEALDKYGRRCMCCGATPESGAIMHVDHIKPRKLHPELALDINNLQILCHECNHGKGNKYETDFRNLEDVI